MYISFVHCMDMSLFQEYQEYLPFVSPNLPMCEINVVNDMSLV